MATAPEMSREYADASPFPHIVLDGRFPADRLRAVAGEVSRMGSEPDPDRSVYAQRQKRTVSTRDEMGLQTLALIDEMNGPAFLAWLEELTGICGLEPDPGLLGGGVHRMRRGGYLKIHSDFNWHRRLQLHRRINVLLYLNENWREEWGGALELWHTDMRACAVRYAPVFNRMVIFSTTDDSFHGHPEPLACPEDVTRDSIALYYYSAQPAPGRKFIHSELTNYQRPDGGWFGPRHLMHQMMLRTPGLRRVLGR